VPDDTLDEASALIKAGKIAEAQEILHPYIRANPQSVEAWILETETWNTAGKIRVLEICLEHNPGNMRVQQVLKDLLSAHQERLMRMAGRGRQAKDETRPRRSDRHDGSGPTESLSAKIDRLASELEQSRRLMEQVKLNFDRLKAEVNDLREALTKLEAESKPGKEA
jgi:chromosome segregation ATPase